MSPVTRARSSRRSSRTDEVQHQVKQLILDRGLESGDPMPTEHELIAELDVSRNSLREALRALQAVGIITIRHGYGMYVGHMSLAGFVDEVTFHGLISQRSGRAQLRNLVQMRRILERGLLEEMLERGLPIISEELTAALEAMRAEAATGTISPETDHRFHAALYAPLHNDLVIHLFGAFWDIYRALQLDLAPMRTSATTTLERHEAIYDAVAAGDRAATVKAIDEHFNGVRERLKLADAAGRANA